MTTPDAALAAVDLPVGHTDTLPLSDVLDRWTPGTEWSWAEEFGELLLVDTADLHVLLEDVHEHGIREPVLLGDDGRVWDGHHRLFVARVLGLPAVPVEYGWGGNPGEVTAALAGIPVQTERRGPADSLAEAITLVVEQTREDLLEVWADQLDAFPAVVEPHLRPGHRIMARVNAVHGARRVWCEPCGETLLVSQEISRA